MLTESQAWELIADAEIKSFVTANRVSEYHLVVLTKDNLHSYSSHGLCYLISNLYVDGYISRNVCHAMRGRYETLPLVYYRFCWPLTEEGQETRKAFARRMAEETRKES